jgi:hypothetical protein
MRSSITLAILAVLLFTGASVRAATFTAEVKDASGRPAANAVVSLEPDSYAAMASPYR